MGVVASDINSEIVDPLARDIAKVTHGVLVGEHDVMAVVGKIPIVGLLARQGLKAVYSITDLGELGVDAVSDGLDLLARPAHVVKKFSQMFRNGHAFLDNLKKLGYFTFRVGTDVLAIAPLANDLFMAKGAGADEEEEIAEEAGLDGAEMGAGDAADVEMRDMAEDVPDNDDDPIDHSDDGASGGDDRLHDPSTAHQSRFRRYIGKLAHASQLYDQGKGPFDVEVPDDPVFTEPGGTHRLPSILPRPPPTPHPTPPPHPIPRAIDDLWFATNNVDRPSVHSAAARGSFSGRPHHYSCASLRELVPRLLRLYPMLTSVVLVTDAGRAVCVVVI